VSIDDEPVIIVDKPWLVTSGVTAYDRMIKLAFASVLEAGEADI